MDNSYTISRFDESLTYIMGESLTHMYVYIYTRIYIHIYIYIHWCLTRQPRQRPATEDSFFKDTANLALKQAVWAVGGTSGEPNKKTWSWSYGLGDQLQMIRQSVFF